MRYAVLCAASLLMVAAANSASAGSPYTYAPTDQRGDRAAAAMGVPNVPDLQGCIPWCRRDQNPCDPPIFKRADGRCEFFD